MLNIYLTIVLAPLVGAVLVGLAGNRLGRQLSHSITILGVAVSTVLSLYVFNHHVLNNGDVFNQNIYTWMQIGGLMTFHDHEHNEDTKTDIDNEMNFHDGALLDELARE